MWQLLSCVLAGCLAAVQPASPGPLRLLFIGNSLTYTNDLPALVAALGRANGRAVLYEQVAGPNLALEDHWQQGEARHAIARGVWDVVVLQQGPSALPESRTQLVSYARRFATEIRKAGATPALLMVWPSRARRGDFPGVSRSYTAAADAVEGILLPVGEAWREAWRRESRLPLYGPDGFHPSALGTHLAALVIYEALTGQAAASAAGAGVTEEQLAVLHAAARAVLSRRR